MHPIDAKALQDIKSRIQALGTIPATFAVWLVDEHIKTLDLMASLEHSLNAMIAAEQATRASVDAPR